tara:strand:+ start:697 stop:1209 length:513 start_codon:yes stop_codon:yes gene_type:complete
MKRILYLHGLESGQGGPKVDSLAASALVSAPDIDYRQPDQWQRLDEMVESGGFDQIIGSSMGGWFAFLLGERHGIDTLLFNPAFHSRTFEPEVDFKLDQSLQQHTVVIGRRDDVVAPAPTVEWLAANNVQASIHFEPEMGHRTPLDRFQAWTEAVIFKPSEDVADKRAAK